MYLRGSARPSDFAMIAPDATTFANFLIDNMVDDFLTDNQLMFLGQFRPVRGLCLTIRRATEWLVLLF